MAVTTAASIIFASGAGSQLEIGVIELGDELSLRPDVSINEQHEFGSRITDNPVEDGSIISDHIFNDPDVLRINAMVSDHPVKFLAGVRRLIDGGTAPRIDAFNKLLEMRDAKKTMTVVTGLHQYRNMIISNLRVTRNSDTGKTLNFSIDFRELLKATTEEVAVPEGLRSAPTTDRGKQPAPPTTDAQGASITVRIVESIVGKEIF